VGRRGPEWHAAVRRRVPHRVTGGRLPNRCIFDRNPDDGEGGSIGSAVAHALPSWGTESGV